MAMKEDPYAEHIKNLLMMCANESPDDPRKQAQLEDKMRDMIKSSREGK